MRALITTLIICLCSSFLLAQTTDTPKKQGTVKGKVLDELQQPVAYATISVSDAEGTLISGGITDEKGKFSLDKLPFGTLAVEVQFLGYQTFTQNVQLSNKERTISLSGIQLQPAQTQLEEVVVTAEHSQYSLQMDRKVFRVGKDVLAQGSNALDILNEVPQVAVDPTGSVTLRGNSQVQILINGRRTGLTMNNAIDQIDGENIDRIEVITNPSASFDANGSAGIINIVLKKNQEYGFKGQVSTTLGTPANYIVRPSLLYKSERLNFFANYRWRYSDYNGLYITDQRNLDNSEITRLTKNEVEDRHDDGRSFYVGGDYYWKERNSVTLAFYRADTKDTDFTALNYDWEGAQSTTALLRNGNSVERRDYNQLEANYTRSYEERGRKWTIDMQYDFWNSNKDWQLNTFGEILPENVPANIRTNNQSGSRDFVVQTDYSLPVGENGKVQFGGKLENRVVTNNYLAESLVDEQWLTFMDIDNDVDYREAISGGYVEYENKLGKLDYKAGIRAEYTSIEISDIENAFTQNKYYLNWFPSAFLSYPFSESSSVQASYSRRINRPFLWDLYPFFEIRDINVLQIGNPDLDPTYTNGYELTYALRKEKFSFNPGIYHRRSEQPFQTFLSQESAELFVLQPVNIEALIETGIEFNASYQPTRALRFTADFNYYQFEDIGTFNGQDLSADGTTWRARVSTQVRLPKELRVQAFYMYTAPRNEAQLNYLSYSDLTLAVSKTILKDRLDISARAFNILDSRIRQTIATTDTYTLEQSSRRYGARYWMTIVYKFNQTERDRMRSAQRGNR
ncbi:MAG: TonB-dependent receptor [Bacteroidota bacterium]